MNDHLIETIYDAALQLKSAEKRRAYLDLACEGNEPLRARIEEMLSAEDRADAFFVDVEPLGGAIEPAEASPEEDLTEINMVEKEGTVIDRYKLLQKIGEGGMGLVYMAEQTQPVTRKVALKIIKLGMDTKQVVARFEAERQALAMMDHPNIAKVLDAGSTDTGRPYFVMELVRGVPITEYCDKNKLSHQDRLNLFVQVCQAIQHAHQKGVIHRDIKPSNVMVTLHDGNAVPKVIDFGIAKATNQKLTEKTLFTNYAHMIGTPAYMSPEQAELSGLDVDTRTDVYSLGVLLYELLTGSTPFGHKELLSKGYGEMQRIIAEQEPPKPSRLLGTMQDQERTVVAKNRSIEISALNKIFQGDLDWIVMKALEKDRSRRYDTANGLADDLRRYKNNEPIQARPPTAVYKFQKAWRRNKVVYGAGAMVFLALFVGLLISFIGFNRAVSARTKANEQRQIATAKADEAQKEKRRAEAIAKARNEDLYLSLVAQAYREVEANRPSDALQLLDQCPKELRQWEWHYLNNRSYTTTPTPLSLEHRLQRMIISPTGRHIAEIAEGVLQLWERSSKTELQLKGIRASVLGTAGWWPAMAFNGDGTQLAAFTADSEIKVWDVISGREILSMNHGSETIRSITFDRKGAELASVDSHGQIRFWNTVTGKEITERAFKATGAYNLVYSPDGKWLAAGGWEIIRMIELETGRVHCDLGKHLTPLSAIAFSPDSKTLVSTDSIYIRVWDIAEGKQTGVIEGHKSWLLTLSFSPDGRRLASAGVDRQLKIWDWQNLNKTLSLTGHRNSISHLMFTPSGELLSGDVNGSIRVWDASPRLNTHQDQVIVLKEHANRIWSLSFLPDGRLLSSGENGRGLIWDMGTNKFSHEISSIFDIVSSLDGRYVLTAHGDADPDVGDKWSPDHQHVIRVLDSLTFNERFKCVSRSGELLCTDMSPSGKYIAAGGYAIDEQQRYNLRIWDWEKSEEPLSLGTHDVGILDVAFSPNGLHLASASADGVVKLWDGTRLNEKQEGQILWPRSAGFELLKIAFSPDSKRLATGDGFNDVVVLDVEKKGSPILRLKGHGEMVVCVAFSPDGRYLASGGADNTVRLWDARNGKHLHTYIGHTSIINALAFGPNSRFLASGGHDYDIRVWRTDFLTR